MIIYIASNNQQKIAELQTAYPSVTIHSYRDLSENITIHETGTNITDNALLKAQIIGSKLNTPVIGDDGGLSLYDYPDYLGIHTSRFFDAHDSDSQKNQKLLRLFKPTDSRIFCLTASLVYYEPNGVTLTVTKNLTGTIAQREIGDDGYGFDTILIPKDYTQSLSELSQQERNSLSPRIQAFKELMRRIQHVSN
ncbi:MAG: non-canonical purine NTP pyrophosphatase [Vagococcus sp.]